MKKILKKNISLRNLNENRVPFKMVLPDGVLKICEILKKNNYNCVVVGGAVRDTLLGLPIKDYDLATDAPPETVDKILRSAGIKTIGTGAAFGVINAFIGDEEYEIATFRTDEYNDNNTTRNPDSVKFTNIETDVKRRDLTINALFYDIGTKEIVDLVGGIDDIKNGVVRTVGNAGKRFDEDRLRILRAIRFAARMGSNLDPAIGAALKVNNSLDGISGERIRDEFIKGIKSAKSSKFFLSLINKYDLFDEIFKGLTPLNKNFVESSDEILVIATLLSGVPYNEISKRLNSLKYSSDEIKQIVFLITFFQLFSKETFYTIKKLQKVSGISDDTFRAFANEVGVDTSLVNKFINFKLSVTGDDTKREFGIKDGPELGSKIKELEYELFINS